MLKLLRWLGALGVAILTISALTPAWNYLGGLLSVTPLVGHADAIVVLGSGILPDGSLGEESLRRAVHGMRLYKEGYAPLLVLSGPSRSDGRGGSEAEARRKLALEMGIESEEILALSAVTTTRDEATGARALLEGRNARSILLVTSGLHMRRAARVFERTGFEVRPAPSDTVPAAAVSPGERLGLMMEVIEQGGAFLYYKLAGFI